MSKTRFFSKGLLSAGLLIFSLGCQRDEIVEYTIPKEEFPQVSSIQKQLEEAHTSMGMPHGHPSLPQNHPHAHDHPHDHDHAHDHAHDHVHDHGHHPHAASGSYERPPMSATVHFAKPSGWQEQELGPMRKASFFVQDEDGSAVDISVMSFPGNTGGVHANFNRWREQVGLYPLAGDELDALIDHREIDGNRYLIIDIEGAPGGATGAGQRIIGAIHPRETETWFFKMMGENQLTAAQREPFLQLLESATYE